jgi:hypothetical protein
LSQVSFRFVIECLTWQTAGLRPPTWQLVDCMMHQVAVAKPASASLVRDDSITPPKLQLD